MKYLLVFCLFVFCLVFQLQRQIGKYLHCLFILFSLFQATVSKDLMEQEAGQKNTLNTWRATDETDPYEMKGAGSFHACPWECN